MPVAHAVRYRMRRIVRLCHRPQKAPQGGPPGQRSYKVCLAVMRLGYIHLGSRTDWTYFQETSRSDACRCYRFVFLVEFRSAPFHDILIFLLREHFRVYYIHRAPHYCRCLHQRRWSLQMYVPRLHQELHVQTGP